MRRADIFTRWHIGRLFFAATVVAIFGFGLAGDDGEAQAARKSQPTPIKDRRFDHAAHATAHKSAKGADMTCSGDCHTVDAEGNFTDGGRKAHARCENCHKFFRSCTSEAKKSGMVCVACHQNFKCVDGPKPDFSKLETSFVATYSHKDHIQPGAGSGRQCEGCHGEFGDSSPKLGSLGGHVNCSACHERGVEPLMSACGGCHVDRTSEAGKVPVAMPRIVTPYATTGRFDHRRHARADRVGTKGRECLACHQNIADSKNAKRVPLPTMDGCYKSCHNGKDAFDAIGSSCTRCHAGGKQP